MSKTYYSIYDNENHILYGEDGDDCIYLTKEDAEDAAMKKMIRKALKNGADQAEIEDKYRGMSPAKAIRNSNYKVCRVYRRYRVHAPNSGWAYEPKKFRTMDEALGFLRKEIIAGRLQRVLDKRRFASLNKEYETLNRIPAEKLAHEEGYRIDLRYETRA